MFMKDFLRDLNERQREAVTAPLGPVLVLAGAGSGKTRVLTYRIAHLIREKLFLPSELLALTFTNKAAGEMKERVGKLLGRDLSVLIGTFHAVGARILRAEIEKLKGGWDRNFVIFDSQDSLHLIKQIVLELGLEEKFRPQVFAYYISAAKNRLVHPKDLDLDNEYFSSTVAEVYELYSKRLAEQNGVDFDDLLLLVCRLYLEQPKILEKYRRRFKYVLVDEYQDTNHAQYVMLKALVAQSRNLFVVGDDAQSIYGFRGANMQNILDFEKDYPEAKIYMLEQNYRSTQNILDAAAAVIRLNPMQYEKKLWTKNPSGAKVYLFEAPDETAESEMVVKKILGLSDSAAENEEKSPEAQSYTPILDSFMNFSRRRFGPSALRPLTSDFRDPTSDLRLPNLGQSVILYRTHAQSRAFEEVLLQAGVPYQIVGGLKFYERREIKDVMAFLRVLFNPRDLVSLARVINLPPRGIGPGNLRKIIAGLPEYSFSFRSLSRNADKLNLDLKAAAGAKEFFSLLDVAESLPKEKSLLELMDLILRRSGYKDAILADRETGEARWENIEELFNVAARYKSQDWSEGLQKFLEEVSLMTDLDSLEEEGRDKLTLMTLHSAKGLEFPNVYFVGLEEGLLPHSRSMMSPEEIAEEVRLAYVGMTRARENLHLSYAKQRLVYGELKRSIPSRILKAIPKKLITKVSIIIDNQ